MPEEKLHDEVRPRTAVLTRGFDPSSCSLHYLVSDSLDGRFESFRMIPDVGRRHRRLHAVQLIAQHLPYLLKDAFAPSHALEMAFSQSAP